MTSQSKRDTAAAWLLSGLACLPLLLYATLGWHTRLIHDDFHYAAIGLEKGAWGGLLHYYQHWTSGYSSVLFKTALAAHAVILPPIVTSLVVLLGALGSYTLLRQCCALLRLDLQRPPALGIASLLVAAAINAFYTLEPFYWYAANIQYTVPLVCLLLCLGLALSTARDAGSGRRLRWGSLVCGTACFLTAGASEMFLVFQLAFLLPLAGLAYVIAPAGRRRSLSIVALAMLLASLLSALVQLASPGIWNRAARDALNYAPPIRHLPALAEITLRMTFESIGRPEVIAGFSLLCALGLALGMRTGHGRHDRRDGLWLIAVRRAALAGLGLQLAFLPLLWAHQSDAPLVLGRFGASYMLVIATNLALILALLGLWRWHRAFAGRLGFAGLASLLLLAYLLLIAMTQVRSIDARASTYLFASGLGMLLMLALLGGAGRADHDTRRLSLAALGLLLTAWLTVAALICVTFIGHGFSSLRIMAGPALLQVSAGLVCGFHLGRLIKLSSDGKRWLSTVRAGSLLTAAVIAGGIFLGQAQLLPRMQSYALEWDARHAEILALRDSGETHIVVAPLSFDLADYIGMGTLRSADMYYGVESLGEQEH